MPGGVSPVIAPGEKNTPVVNPIILSKSKGLWCVAEKYLNIRRELHDKA
jgi:hypothetical protein